MSGAVEGQGRCGKILLAIGATLLIFPNGVTWYWGNVSVLALSYIVWQAPQTRGVDTPWVISLYIVCRAAGLMGYDWSRRLVGKQLTIVLGILVSDASLLACYWAVQESLLLLNLALGVCVGLGSGLLYGNALQTMVNLTDNRVGLLTSIVQGSFGAGAIAINAFVTLYANPDNLSPDLQLRFSSYFTQKEVLDRVPRLFLLMGLFSAVIHAVAYFLINLGRIVHTCKGKCKDKRTLSLGSSFSPEYNVETGTTKNAASSKTAQEMPNRLESSNAFEDSSHYENSPIMEGSNPGETTSAIPGPFADQASGESHSDFSPKEMLKTAVFYTFWFSFFVGDFPIVLIINYYKSFGQIWIHDDHFLTVVGTTLVFFNAWIRALWGLVIDKIGSKNTLMVILAPLVMVNAWYYFSAMDSRWIYFAMTFLFGTLSGAMYSIFPAVMVLVFGKKHFAINFGILTSASIVFNLVGPVVIERMLAHYGWFVTYATSAGLNAISLVLMLKFVPL